MPTPHSVPLSSLSPPENVPGQQVLSLVESLSRDNLIAELTLAARTDPSVYSWLKKRYGPQHGPAIANRISKRTYTPQMPVARPQHDLQRKMPERVRQLHREDRSSILARKLGGHIAYIKGICLDKPSLQTRKDALELLCEIGELLLRGNGHESGELALEHYRHHDLLEDTIHNIVETLQTQSEIDY